MYFANAAITSIIFYACLFLTILSLWMPRFKNVPIWYLPFAFTVILGFIARHVTLYALVPIILLAITTQILRRKHLPLWMQALAGAALVILSLGLSAHLFPGFYNLKVIDSARISADGIPFTLYLNFDKTLVGLFILGELHQLIRTREAWIPMLRGTLPRAVPIILGTAVLSLVFQFVRIDPKVPDILPIWAAANLFLVCLAEEGLFRGFIQKYLTEILQHVRYGKVIALFAASLLFGLAHFAGGTLYVVLSTVAGLGYGWVYLKTESIEASMITHFLLNLFHILLLTYPALEGAV